MRSHTLLAALLACIAARAGAQDPICVIDGQRVPPDQCGLHAASPEDPLARYLFPPELVMAHQQAIELTERQRATVRDAIKEAQGKFVDLQFQMSAEVEKLQRLLQGSTVQETSVLQQVDRVLGLERELKHAQLTLLIRIKNALTEEQQASLTRLRRQAPNGQPVQPRMKTPSSP